jgi:hypothetical protein
MSNRNRDEMANLAQETYCLDDVEKKAWKDGWDACEEQSKAELEQLKYKFFIMYNALLKISHGHFYKESIDNIKIINEALSKVEKSNVKF